MENMMTGGQAPSPAYDFRVYDQVWQRVAPGTDPFSPSEAPFFSASRASAAIR